MGVAWEIDPRASVLVLRRECGKRVIAEGASASFELRQETALGIGRGVLFDQRLGETLPYEPKNSRTDGDRDGTGEE